MALIKCPKCGTTNIDVIESQTTYFIFHQDTSGIPDEDNRDEILGDITDTSGYCTVCDYYWSLSYPVDYLRELQKEERKQNGAD